MKKNRDTLLLGHKVVLVPYRDYHVPKYHEWMLDPALRELTASEQLSLGEEYEMQRRWQEDTDKLTFIILARRASGSDHDELQCSDDGVAVEGLQLSPDDARIRALPMVGDVNLFLKGTLPSSTGTNARIHVGARMSGDINEEEDNFEVEMEVMIAETPYRRCGYAYEALLLLLSYATSHPSAFLPAVPRQPELQSLEPYLKKVSQQSPSSLNQTITPERLVIRISESNLPSIRLFGKLGFKVVKRVAVFEEVEMRWGSRDSTL